MPSRLLREGILDSTAVNELSFPAEVFYRRLMSVVDDYGRFDGRPAILRGRLFALKIDSVREADITRWIAECVKAGLLALYTVDAKPYILFTKLGSPRAKESKYPPPPSEPDPQPDQHTSVNGCAQMKTDANGCAQPQTDAPGSGSGSGSGTSSDSGASSGASAADAVTVPPGLDTPAFREAWGNWLRLKSGAKLKPPAQARQLGKLAELGPDAAVKCIEYSLMNQYQGLFPEKFAGGSHGGSNGPGRGVGRPGRAEPPPGKYDDLDGPPGVAQRGAATLPFPPGGSGNQARAG